MIPPSVTNNGSIFYIYDSIATEGASNTNPNLSCEVDGDGDPSNGFEIVFFAGTSDEEVYSCDGP